MKQASFSGSGTAPLVRTVALTLGIAALGAFFSQMLPPTPLTVSAARADVDPRGSRREFSASQFIQGMKSANEQVRVKTVLRAEEDWANPGYVKITGDKVAFQNLLAMLEHPEWEVCGAAGNLLHFIGLRASPNARRKIADAIEKHIAVEKAQPEAFINTLILIAPERAAAPLLRSIKEDRIQLYSAFEPLQTLRKKGLVTQQQYNEAVGDLLRNIKPYLAKRMTEGEQHLNAMRNEWAVGARSEYEDCRRALAGCLRRLKELGVDIQADPELTKVQAWLQRK